jgi:hypothetical protein
LPHGHLPRTAPEHTQVQGERRDDDNRENNPRDPIPVVRQFEIRAALPLLCAERLCLSEDDLFYFGKALKL